MMIVRVVVLIREEKRKVIQGDGELVRKKAIQERYSSLGSGR